MKNKKQINWAVKLLADTANSQRCTCGHLKVKHHYQASGCNQFKCPCDKFVALDSGFFNRCPNEHCNAVLFYPNWDKENEFFCDQCKSEFKFDGCESFTEL